MLQTVLDSNQPYKRKGRVSYHSAFEPCRLSRPSWINPRQRPTLPRTCARSTIGGSRLNFRVRNGNGCDPAPMATGKLVRHRPFGLRRNLVSGVPPEASYAASQEGRPRAFRCKEQRSYNTGRRLTTEYSAIGNLFDHTPRRSCEVNKWSSLTAD